MTPWVIDFEAFSEAEIKDVGAWIYTLHPSTEALCLSYGPQDRPRAYLWIPGMPPPTVLFHIIANGGVLEAHNDFFEGSFWNNVCVPKLGWPPLPFEQLRDSAALAAAHGLPRKLETLCKALELPVEKDAKGHRVMLQVCKPRKPTKNNAATRWTPLNAPDKFLKTYSYCVTDYLAERQIPDRVPQLSPYEEAVRQMDKQINVRGVHADRQLAEAARSIIEQAEAKYNDELYTLTGGAVEAATKTKVLGEWVRSQGYQIPNMQAATITDALDDPKITPAVKRALEIRAVLGSASVKKVYAILNRMSPVDDRIRDIFTYCGADRTGRWAGSGVQPQNLPASGPEVVLCPSCGPMHDKLQPALMCWLCARPVKPMEWGIEAMQVAIQHILTGQLATVEYYWGDPLKAVSGVVRGMLDAAAGHEFICSDFSAIEAVVLAALAGEEWRLDVFRTHGMIYEASAAAITGIPFEEFVRYKEENNQHHPMRKKVGKVAELASGYQGGLGAWKAFGADKFMSEDEIRENVRKWRAASPMIVKFWYGAEEAAHNAIRRPQTWQAYRSISYYYDGTSVLYCRLPSGRCLAYHQAKLHQVIKFDRPAWELSFMGTDQTTRQWKRIPTWGGRLVENITQATARDLLAHGMLALHATGRYPIVLHVHDEVISEVPAGTGSIEEFETLMATLPDWAADWPIKAAGGWRGDRYRKD